MATAAITASDVISNCKTANSAFQSATAASPPTGRRRKTDTYALPKSRRISPTMRNKARANPVLQFRRDFMRPANYLRCHFRSGRQARKEAIRVAVGGCLRWQTIHCRGLPTACSLKLGTSLLSVPKKPHAVRETGRPFCCRCDLLRLID